MCYTYILWLDLWYSGALKWDKFMTAFMYNETAGWGKTKSKTGQQKTVIRPSRNLLKAVPVHCNPCFPIKPLGNKENKSKPLKMTKQSDSGCTVDTNQMKSLQCAQKVGCRKNHSWNWWSLISNTFFCLIAPLLLNPLVKPLGCSNSAILEHLQYSPSANV